MSSYRARITKWYGDQLTPVTEDACGHDHVKAGAAAKCAAVKVRALLNVGADSLPHTVSYQVVRHDDA